MRVRGTALINFEIELEDVDDITEENIPIRESDKLIANEINKHLPIGYYVNGDIFVSTPPKL